MFFVVYYLLRNDRGFGAVDFRKLQRCLRLDGFCAFLHTELKHVDKEERENKHDDWLGKKKGYFTRTTQPAQKFLEIMMEYLENIDYAR